MRVSLIRLFRRILDDADHAITSVRLPILDWIAGPESLTRADRQREADHERIAASISQDRYRSQDIEALRARSRVPYTLAREAGLLGAQHGRTSINFRVLYQLIKA
jgi:hypothetical protein